MPLENKNKPNRYIISVRTDFGFIGVEGVTIDDVVDAMTSLPELMEKAYSKYREITFPRPPPPIPVGKPELENIIGRGPNGTYDVLVPLEKLSGKQIIFLIMYDQYPKALTPSELADLVSQCWKRIDPSYVSSYLTQKFYRDFFVSVQRTDGQTGYKLSGIGINNVTSKSLPKIKKNLT